jgi:DNA-binding LacI/PurR family transcriptional regulator
MTSLTPMVITQRDVAARAGVSVSVVSAVLAGSKSVRMSPETRERVEEAIADTGYRTNHAAKALRQSRSGIVSVVVPKITNPILNEAVEGIQDAAEADGTVVIISEADRLSGGSKLLTRLVGTQMTDGFLVRATKVGDEAIAEFARRGIPFVVLNRPGPERHVGVWVDDSSGVAAAAEHLLAAGHRRIAFVGGPDHGLGVDDRIAGFRRAHEERGRRPDETLVRAVGYDPATIALATTDLVTGRRPPTGLIVDNAWVAAGAVAALVDQGVRIPEDMSVITYHDLPQGEFVRPALSAVRMPVREAGQAGFAVLQKMIMGGRGRSATIRRPGPLVVDRGSVTRPRRT